MQKHENSNVDTDSGAVDQTRLRGFSLKSSTIVSHGSTDHIFQSALTTESNPLLANFTQTNMLLFSAIKLTAITITGLLFYKAETKTKLSKEISPFGKKFVKSGYLISLFALSAVVLNNFSVIAKLA